MGLSISSPKAPEKPREFIFRQEQALKRTTTRKRNTEGGLEARVIIALLATISVLEPFQMTRTRMRRTAGDVSGRDSLMVEGDLYQTNEGQTTQTPLSTQGFAYRIFNDQFNSTGGSVLTR